MHLVVNRVSKQYPTRGEPLSVLREVSLQLASGENAAIVGPSGSGKSTLAKLMQGFYQPSDGAILIDDRDIRESGPGMHPEIRIKWQSQQLGCFAGGNLNPA